MKTHIILNIGILISVFLLLIYFLFQYFNQQKKSETSEVLKRRPQEPEMDIRDHVHFMYEAVKIAIDGMDENEGGPFGCVIVKNGEIVGKGNNKVTSNNDPTAHAEIVAIRDACKNLNSFQLDDCILYANCEPCPMCLGAIYWARPLKVFYGASQKDAADIGFDDQFIYQEITLAFDERSIPFEQIEREIALKPFQVWQTKENKIKY